MLRGRSAVLAARMVHVNRVGGVGWGVGGSRSLAAFTGVHVGVLTRGWQRRNVWSPLLATKPADSTNQLINDTEVWILIGDKSDAPPEAIGV